MKIYVYAIALAASCSGTTESPMPYHIDLSAPSDQSVSDLVSQGAWCIRRDMFDLCWGKTECFQTSECSMINCRGLQGVCVKGVGDAFGYCYYPIR